MRVYLDHSATTPVRPEVLEAMAPFFSETFGNASSAHEFGRAAGAAARQAKRTVAALLGASPDEIVFTSGGTEADNLAVQGVAAAGRNRGRHIITSAVEHKAVLNCCHYLAKEGYEVTVLPVDGAGRVDPGAVAAAIRPDTILVSIMLANNETGTLQPIPEISSLTRARRIPLHTDAVQAIGKIPVNVDELGVDLLSISAHKFCGPKGVGALYVRRGTRITPVIHGGQHGAGLRAGTENVAGVVGVGRAMELATAELPDFLRDVGALRGRLEEGIRSSLPGVRLNGHPENRLPNVLNVSFDGVEGDTLALVLDAKGVAVSTGSACDSGVADPSHVLVAMGIPPEITGGSVRFSLGRSTTTEEIDYALECVSESVTRMRQRHRAGGAG